MWKNERDIPTKWTNDAKDHFRYLLHHYSAFAKVLQYLKVSDKIFKDLNILAVLAKITQSNITKYTLIK